MSIESQIQAAASQNSHLLSILSTTDYAPPALSQHNKYIADLESSIQTTDSQIKKLETSRAKELKEHEKYRDSVMKRFAYKVGRKQDKFAAKAEKEEREYFDALQDEHKAKESRKDLGHRLEEAKTARAQLETVAGQHARAQGELDALYDSIFEGPTPGFPEEDQREQSAHAALQRYHNLRSQAEGEGQAVNILTAAKSKLRTAAMAMDNALDYSRMDMFGGGSMTDMMERSELSKAEVLVAQAQTDIAQAQRMSGGVQPLPPINIAKGNLMSDVLFDNIFSDMAFHDKIKASRMELQRGADALEQQLGTVKQAHAAMSRDLVQVAKELEDSRVALQKSREVAFERVVGSRVG